MAAIDDLNKAVTDLETRINAAVEGFAELNTKITDLTTALAAAPNLDPAIEAAANSIQALIGKLNGSIPTTLSAPPAQ